MHAAGKAVKNKIDSGEMSEKRLQRKKDGDLHELQLDDSTMRRRRDFAVMPRRLAVDTKAKAASWFGAQILGPVTIGESARIGASAVVLSDIPNEATAVGIPAKVVRIKGKKVSQDDQNL